MLVPVSAARMAADAEEDVLRSFKSQLAMCVAAAEAEQAADDSTATASSPFLASASAASSLSALSSLSHSHSHSHSHFHSHSPFSASLPALSPASPPSSSRPSRLLSLLQSHLFYSSLRDVAALRPTNRLLSFVRDDSSAFPSAATSHFGRMALLPLLIHFVRASLQLDDAAASHSLTAASAFRKPNSATAPAAAAAAASSASASPSSFLASSPAASSSSSSSPSLSFSSMLASPSPSYFPSAPPTSSPYLVSFSSPSASSTSSSSSSPSTSFPLSLSSSSPSPRPDVVVVFGLLFDCLFVLLRALLSTIAPVPPALLAQQTATDSSSAAFSSSSSTSSPLPSSSPSASPSSSGPPSRPSIDAALRHAAAVNDIIDSLAALVSDVLLHSPFPCTSASNSPFVSRAAIHNALVVRFVRCLTDGAPPPLPAAPPAQLSTRRHLSSFPDVLDRVRSVMAASSSHTVPPPLPSASTAVSAPSDRTHLLDDLEQLQLRAADTALSLPRSFSSSAAVGATSALLIAPSSAASHIVSIEREREKERLYDRLLVPHGVSSDDHQQLTSMAIDASMTVKPPPVNGVIKTEKADGATDGSTVKDALPLSRVMDAAAARVVTQLTARYKAMIKARKASLALSPAAAGLSAVAAVTIDRLPVLKLLYSVMTRCTVLTVHECAAIVQAVTEDLLAIVYIPAGSPPPSLPAASPSLLSSLSTSSSLPPSAALLASALSADPSFSSIFPVINDALTLSAAALRDAVLCCAFLSFAAGEESSHKQPNGGGKDKKEQPSTAAAAAVPSSSSLVVVKKEQDESKSSPVDIGRHRPSIPSYLTSHSLRPYSASQLGLNARIASYAMRAHPYLSMSASSSGGSSSSSSLSNAPVTSSSFSSASSSSSLGSLSFPASTSLSDFHSSLLHSSSASSSSSSLLHDDDDWFLPSFHDPVYSAPSSSSSASQLSSLSAPVSSFSSSASSISLPSSLPSASSSASSSSSSSISASSTTSASAFTSSTSASASSGLVSSPVGAGSTASPAAVDPYSALLSANSSHIRVLSGVKEADEDDDEDEDETDAIRRLEARAEREMAMLRSSVVAAGGDESKDVQDDEEDEAVHERALAAAAAAEDDEDSDDSAEAAEAAEAAEGAAHGEDDSVESASDDDEAAGEEGDEDDGEGDGDVEVEGMDEVDVDIEAELSEAYSPPPMLETHIEPIDAADGKVQSVMKDVFSEEEQASNGGTTRAAAEAGRDNNALEACPGSTFLSSPPHVFAMVRDCLLRCQPALPAVLLQLINHAYCTLTAHSASVDGWEADDGSSVVAGSSSGTAGSTIASGSKAGSQTMVADELRLICAPFFPDSRTFHQYINAPLSSTLSSFSSPPAPLSPAPSVITSASSTLLSARYLLLSCLNLALFMLKAERHAQQHAQASSAATTSQSIPATAPSVLPAPTSSSASSSSSMPSRSSYFVPSAWTSSCCHLLYLFRRQVDVCKLVKKLLTAVAGSDSARHQLSDIFTYQHDFALLAILFYPTNPSLLLTPPPSPRTPPSFFHTYNSLLSSPPLAYPARLKLLHLLHRVEQQAKRRPTHFLSLINQCPQLLYVLLLLSVWLADEAEETSIPLCVRLIALVSQQRWGKQLTNNGGEDSDEADEEEDDDEEDSEMGEEGKQREEKNDRTHDSNMETETDEQKKAADSSSTASCPFSSLFDSLVSQPSLLTSFIQHYLLGSADFTHRTHAQSFLFFMWTNSSPHTRTALFSQLSAWLPNIPLYGKHAQQLCHLISALLTASVDSTDAGPSSVDISLAVQRLMSAVAVQSAVLSSHPMGDFFYSLSQTLNQQRQLTALTEHAKVQQKLYEQYSTTVPCHVCHATSGLEHTSKDKQKSSQTTQLTAGSASAAHPTSSSSSSAVGSTVGSSALTSASAVSSSHFAGSSAGVSGSSSGSSSDFTSPATDFHVYKLSALASDSKFGVQHRAIKLHSAFVIPALVLRIIQPTAPSSSSSSSSSSASAAAAASSSQSYSVPQRAVKTIHVYFPSHPASDLSSLPLPFAVTGVARDKRHSHWTLAKTITLSPTQKEAKLSFSLPLHTSFLLIHYASFHASEQREAELLKCPRCHCDVQRGVCPQCRENAYQCFPALQTRILTDSGFLFLDEIERRLEAGERVLYACYAPNSTTPQLKGDDVLEGKLLYRDGELFFPEPADIPTSLVEMRSADEQRRWVDGSGPYGLGSSVGDVDEDEGVNEMEDEDEDDEKKEESGARPRRLYSRHVSLLVTPDHDMYVQMGNVDGQGDFHPQQERRGAEKGKKLPPAKKIPPSKVKASQLLDAPHERACVRLLACASSGHTPAPEAAQPVKDKLGLKNKAQFDAFLELFGFWLGDGTMLYSRSGASGSGSVRFSQVKQADIDFLDRTLPRTGLRAREVLRYETQLKRKDGKQRTVVTWDIVNTAWFDFFDAEFGNKYRKPGRPFDQSIAVTRQGNRRPSTSSTLSPPSNASRTRSSSSASSLSISLSSAMDEAGDERKDDELVSMSDALCAECGGGSDGSLCDSSVDGVPDSLAKYTGDGEDELYSPSTSSSEPPSSQAEETPMEDEPPTTAEPPAEAPLLQLEPPTDPDNPIKSAKWLPVWSVMHLSCQQLRLLINGLYRADGHFECDRKTIYTSGVAFRDQLMQALLHCGYTAWPRLMYAKDTVRAYRWHDQKADVTIYSIAEYKQLTPDEQLNYREIKANADNWAVHWTEPVKSGKGPCWPIVKRQQGIKEVPYSEAEHGRIWCVKVKHRAHLIVAQRALRDPKTGVVNKQSRPIVVGQCRQCRNINYDNLTGFLCNECGHCKYGTFSWSVMAAPSLAIDRIKGEEECRQRISEMDIIAQQLSELQQEGERLQRDVRGIVNRCSGPLQSSKVRGDDVSVVSAECLQSMEQPPFSSALFTSAVHKRSSISFASNGLTSSSSSLPASAILSSHQPSSAAPTIPGLSSPLDHLLLTRVRKHHSDLSKTYRLYLNTKREIGRYLGSAATVCPPTDADTWQAHSTHCFLCGRDSVALSVKLLAELPMSCVRGWVAASALVHQPSLSARPWHWHAVLERVMAGSGCWSEDDVQQCGKYLLAVLCNEPTLSSASESYLSERVQPLLLYGLRHPAGEAAEAEPFVDFLHLLIMSQLQQSGDVVSPVLLTALTLCVEVLLASIDRFDSPSVAEFVIVPLLRLVTRAAQLPNIPSSASSGTSSRLAAATRRSSSPLSVESPALSGEMRSPFFASLSSVGLSSVVMSPSIQPAAAPAASASHFSPSKAKPPSAVSAMASSSPRKRTSPAFASLSFPSPVRSSPLSSPVPSASQPSQSSDSRSIAVSPPAHSTNPFASPPTSLPPLQLPAVSSATATAASRSGMDHPQYQSVSMSRLQTLFARLSSFLVQLGVHSSVPSSLLPSAAALSEWHMGVLHGRSSPSTCSPLVIRHVVDRWRHYTGGKASRHSLPYIRLRRLLLNPVSDDVQSSTAHLLFLLSSLPAGEDERPTVAETAPSPSEQPSMEVEGDEKLNDTVVLDVASRESSVSRAVLPLAEQRTQCLLDVLLSVLSSLTRDEARHSSHFFAVFAELLNSSSSAAVNASYKRRCVIRGVLPVIMQRMAEQLAALAEREEINSSAVLSRSQYANNSITQDPSFCLYGLSSLLIDLLSVPEVKRTFLRNPSHASAILSSYLRMRGLVFARSRLTELTTQHLHSLVTLLFNADDKRSAIRAYLNALQDSHAAVSSSSAFATQSSSYNVSRSLTYIIQQLVDIIRPPQPSKHYQLVLRKSPTQEEFIRGNMRRSPYSSSSFPGPLFRDIVELICSELKLTNEDNMFELLVAGKIVALDLPIAKVYEKVWRPHVAQQQQHSGAAAGGAMGGAGMDAGERERLRERERERERDRQRLRARDRERMLLLGAEAALSLHSDYMSDGSDDASDDMAEPPMQLPTVPSVAAPTPPMTVTFRLTGLDGEATEPLVDSLPDDQAERVDAEEEYQACDVMRESAASGVSGLGQLVRRLSAISDLSHPVDYKLVQVMLKALTYACQLRANRRHVLDMTAPDGQQPQQQQQQQQHVGPYVLRVLMQQLNLSLSAIQHIPAHVLASSSFKDEPAAKTALDLALSITQLIQALMQEQNKQDAEGDSTRSSGSDGPSTPIRLSDGVPPLPQHSVHPSSLGHFESLLSLLHSPSVRAHTPLIESIVATLPGLTFGSFDLLQLLYATFAPYIAPLPHKELPTDADSQWWVTALIEVLSNTPKEGALGRHVRQFMFDRRMPHMLREYVQSHMSADVKENSATTGAEVEATEATRAARMDLTSSAAASLNEFVELPSLPIVLQLLNGLVAAHPPSQSECSSLIPLLQQLESISSSKRIGSLSEQLLSSLTYNNSHTERLLAELRSSTKADKQKKAAERRRQLLQKLGINSSPDLKGKLVLADDKVLGFKDVQEDDDLLRCCVCREGYTCKPGQMLGMYVYVKPVHVALDDTMTIMADGLPLDGDDVDELGVCTVTHFNLIHYRCHQEAVKADKKLKPPKSEWDGAMIRNAHTLTNALFPLLLPPTASTADDDVSFDQYAQAVETYWSRFQFSSRLTLPRFMLVMEDLKVLLLRYANEESFSADSRGGGRESNVALLVYLLQMALMCFSQCQIGEGVREAIEKMHKQAVKALIQVGGGLGGREGLGATEEEEKEGKEREEKEATGKEVQDDEEKEAMAAVSQSEASDVDILRSGKRRRRKRSSPASSRTTRSRKKQRKTATAAATPSTSLTTEEQRLLDMYTAAAPAAAATSSATTAATASTAADDDADTMWEHAHLDHWLTILAASLLLNSSDEWTAMRWAAVSKLMTLTAQQVDDLCTTSRCEEGGGVDEDTLPEDERATLLVQRVSACRPVLLFVAIIQQLHQSMHKPPFATPPPPYPPPTANWSLPLSSVSPSSPPASSSSAGSTALLASRWSFLQRFDGLLIRELQSSLLPFLGRHSRLKHDKDGKAEAVRELEELMDRLGVTERVKAEHDGDVELMMRAMFQRKAVPVVLDEESKMDATARVD